MKAKMGFFLFFSKSKLQMASPGLKLELHRLFEKWSNFWTLSRIPKMVRMEMNPPVLNEIFATNRNGSETNLKKEWSENGSEAKILKRLEICWRNRRLDSKVDEKFIVFLFFKKSNVVFRKKPIIFPKNPCFCEEHFCWVKYFTLLEYSTVIVGNWLFNALMYKFFA